MVHERDAQLTAMAAQLIEDFGQAQRAIGLFVVDRARVDRIRALAQVAAEIARRAQQREPNTEDFRQWTLTLTTDDLSALVSAFEDLSPDDLDPFP